MMSILLVIVACIIIGVLIGIRNDAKVNKELEEDYKNKEQMENADITHPPYSMGEYYNDGKNQGYVFSIKEGGYHGKIISLCEWNGQWSLTKESYGSTLQPPVLASSYKSGKINKQIIQKLVLTSDYPILWNIEHSYAYTKTDWYLPAIEELMELAKYRILINSNIRNHRYTYVHAHSIGDHEYLSSTELENKILCYSFLSNSIWEEKKDYETSYRLVFEF